MLITTISYADQKAITDTGEEIFIYSDGTWKYINNVKHKSDEIQINKNVFNKPDDSSFLVKSKKNKSAFWVNTKKWSFSKNKSHDEDKEYDFQLKGKDLYGTAITEEIEVPLETLTDIALSNAEKGTGSDIKILKKEYRKVNGKKVIHMEMTGTMQGIKFTYLGYYYSDTYGTTQFIVFTAANLVDKYRSEIDRLLNGLDTQ